ncbi:hypothetical protein PR003_g13260 [Phytophthora rubi]|uniref:WW domain-containing protein n=1 Tax=Phytophthora rubi TaxID=129364 RepID=A0A6A4F714_9STRA|nr:hypothetical protein PR002_g12730 [Phytophthora rubi]KAE9025103.1 hypothetical protein PR001_g12512 [Phytophthora rubi]KAE9334944.1 hypothetical protein PR003_g13260 [Phytophthora rubi]
MRTELDASAARIKKKKRSSERSKRHDRPLEHGEGGGEWKQFTSPDGHPYYYNAVTKESRWEPPTEEQPKHQRPKGSSKQMDLEQETPLNEAPAKKEEKKKRPESRRSATEEAPAVRTSKNAMFQKLQASLEGRLNGAMMGRPPPMLDIRQGEAERQQEEKKTPSLEEQYEAETAGMSAAERLRFLRKKRQEDMMARRESVAGDDFMAEVANNMKKKGKERDSGEKGRSWKEQEQVEEERKRQQMQEEMEAKEKEGKEREEQEARERELRREQERAEQVALEERREQERIQRQEEEDRRRLEKEEKRKKRKEKKNSADLEERGSERDGVAAREKDATAPDAQGIDIIGAQDEEASDASSPERVRHRSRSRSRGSKRGSSVRSLQYENAKAAASTKGDNSPVEGGHSAKVASDPVLYEKQRAREERRARKLREKELMASKRTESATSESQRRKSVSSAGDVTEDSSTRTTSSAEAEEEARAIEKQLRRERRRVAKLEAALAAQGLDDDHGNVQHERSQAEHTEQHATSSNGSTPGSAHAGNYPMNGQNPPLSGGMYAPYPYMMMPPPPTPYGYYYPYMQPPPMMPAPMSAPMYPPGMVGVPPGYQLVPPTPPPSSDDVATPSAMVPYSAESTLESAYGMPFGLYGQQSAPELSRCDCCHGIGVGLVEKNGVCGHCNRLRLAFIVDSAQMRQRCSVCGGWGFQLLQANGMCEHCTRLTAQKSTRKLIAGARRRSSGAIPLGAGAPSPPKRNSMPKNNILDDVDWDKSSSDDSDWDD